MYRKPTADATIGVEITVTIRKIKHFIFTITACALFGVPTLFAETPEPYQLDNGLTVILRPMPKATKLAFVVLFNLGNAHDPIGKSGMTHLLEHLYVTAAAGDTPARNAQQFMERYPAGWNAQTGLDFTVIAGVVEPVQFAEELADVAARMNDLHITEADLGREVPRVLAELKNMYGGLPWLAGLNHTRAQLYAVPQGGQYGGAPAHVQAITLSELQQFWKDYYKPSNAILIIAGKFDLAEARTSIHTNFSQIPAGKRPPTKPPTATAKTGEVHRVTVTPLVKDATGVAAIGWTPPAIASEEYVPFLVVVSRLWASLHRPAQMRKVQPIYYAPLMDPTTIALQTELAAEEDAEPRLRELNQQLHTALPAKLTQYNKRQTIQMIRWLFYPGRYSDLDLLAFTVGRQYQLQIDTQSLIDAVERVTDADIRLLATRIFAPEKRAAVVIELDK